MSAFPRANVARLGAFIQARELVRVRRESGVAKPWTADPILRAYRFCNVRREDDKVTKWIDAYVRKPFALNDHLWFMLCIARLINEPDVLLDVMRHGAAWPERSWSPAGFAHVLKNRAKCGQKITTGVYMVTTHGSGKPKPDYLAENYLLPLWQCRRQLAPRLESKGVRLRDWYEALVNFNGWGDFFCGQVIADAKHTRYLRKASDWHDWAVLGPGSERGLRRVMGVPLPAERPAGGNVRKPKYAPSRADKAHNIELLGELRALLKPTWRKLKLDVCLQDLQNCLCEFDKYERERLGEGHPRNRYEGV